MARPRALTLLVVLGALLGHLPCFGFVPAPGFGCRGSRNRLILARPVLVTGAAVVAAAPAVAVGPLDAASVDLTVVAAWLGSISTLLSVGVAFQQRQEAEQQRRAAERQNEIAEEVKKIQQRQAQIDYEASDPGRIESAVTKFLTLFVPKTAERKVVHREVMETVQRRVASWGCDDEGDTTIVSGRFGSGKTVAVEEALRGLPGVISASVQDNSWEQKLHAELGVTGPKMLQEVLETVRDKLQQMPSPTTQYPIIVLEIPRATTEGSALVSTFGKQLSSDSLSAHVIVTASSAAAALAFDAGGNFRQLDIWVDDFTEDEAALFLEQRGQKAVAGVLIETVGLRAGDLKEATRFIRKGGSVAAFGLIMKQRRQRELNRFLALDLPGRGGTLVPVGENLVDTLLQASYEEGTEDFLDKQGIRPKMVAAAVRELDAHAVVWQPVQRRWRFASAAHMALAATQRPAAVRSSGA